MLKTRVVAIVVLLVAAAVASGCATSGAVPRPRPFPGAPDPPDRSNPPSPATAPPSALLTTALDLRGVPYRNGGSEPARGFDCSGFVQWVFAQHGTPLPREVREQYDAGTPIDRDAIRAGDLVFFETVSRGPSHVGIALGEGEFVHAPSSRGVVRVENYSSRYWAARWVGARRITGTGAADLQ